MSRLPLGFLLSLSCANAAFAQLPVRLAETVPAGAIYRVSAKSAILGELSIPDGSAAEVLKVRGNSELVYDERPLPPLTDGTLRVARSYRTVNISRTMDDREQTAEVRPAVRRMVVLRSSEGAKAPFSPDGPLTWGEIDVVRTDFFTPALVAGLLPKQAVRPNERWSAEEIAVRELTDFDTITKGSLEVSFVSVVQVERESHAKLSFIGNIEGTTNDGPSKQQITGTAYFNLDRNLLTYINLKGTHDLLNAEGQTTGRINGTFILERKPTGEATDLSDLALSRLTLEPNVENTRLLFDNPGLGLRFEYPRRWRVGNAEGTRITIDGPSGAGILLTIQPAAKTPSSDQYQTEVRDYITKQQWPILKMDRPRIVASRPVRIDRFGMDVKTDKESVRLEYAVIVQGEIGATAAVRLPATQTELLQSDVDAVLGTIRLSETERK